ncbi:MAG: ZIP family metal transporter [Promethearchaeota archaeon]|nr:MAG: ZIP family metal transporter [Candidatus Lokiarchaeota archaeon]
MTIWLIIIFSILGSIGAISAAASFTLLSEDRQKIVVPSLLSFATGTLLAAALLGLIPKALHEAGHEFSQYVMITLLGGILLFFFIEKVLIWRDCKDIECEVHGAEAAGPIVLIGDALHNFVDGIIIASAFLTNFAIGISVSIGIIAHEIPQETGDFGILLHSGFSKKKAYIYNALSSSTTIPSGIISFFILNTLQFLVPYMLAISAASFLYISLSDLTPELHRKWEAKETIQQLLLICVGILLMFLVMNLVPHGH